MKTAQKRAFRLSKVDWILIAFVALLALAAIFFWMRHLKGKETALEVEYTVLLENLPLREGGERQAWDFILTGGEVYNQNGTIILGRVVEYRVSDHKEPRLIDGEIEAKAVPDRRDVWIRVRAEASLRPEDGIRIGGIRMAAGMRGDFRFGNYEAKGARVLWIGEVSP